MSARLSVNNDSTDSISAGYEKRWTDIIFLPFNELWQFFIHLSVTINTLIIVYGFAYDHASENNPVYLSIYYLCEVIYFVDTVLYLAHRSMIKHRILREYAPKNALLLVVDVISLFPIYEVIALLSATSRDGIENLYGIRSWVHFIRLVRVYGVFKYFAKMNHQAGIDHVVIIILGHSVLLILLAHSLGALWYYLGCYKCEEKNWTVNLEHFHFDSRNPIHWLIISLSVTNGGLVYNWIGPLRAETVTERALLTAIFLLGFGLQFLLIFGRLIGAFAGKFRTRFLFYDRLKRINWHLDDWEIEKEWQCKTIDYYNKLFQKRSGIRDMPPFFKFLPLSLQKEVGLDIFWEAFRHSHLFREEDVSFKRALSLVMKCEFYLAGDYVYKLNKTKGKMIFIVSGVLQILTEEDDESPIMSLSSGTILGELSCFLAIPSRANVRCATYCELRTLESSSLTKLLCDYPGKTRQLQKRITEMIKHARMMYELVQQYKMNTNLLDINKDSSIKWIKQRWRQILAVQNRHVKKGFDEEATIKIDLNHSSKHLDLLVLSDAVELKIQAICLKGSCPFVLEPSSSFRMFFDYVVLLSVFLQCCILPYIISFARVINRYMYLIFFLFDWIYFIDIYCQLSTAIKKKNYTVNKPGLIVLKRLKDIFFLVDLIATIPFDYAGFIIGMDYQTVALLRIPRMLKFHKCFSFILEKEQNIWLDPLKIRIFKYVVLYLFSRYCVTCLMYAFTCFKPKCDKYGWLYYNWYLGGITSNANLQHPLVTSLSYTAGLFLNVGFCDIMQYTIFDRLTGLFVSVAGYYLFCFCLSELCGAYMLHFQSFLRYQNYIRTIQHFMNVNRVNPELQEQVNSALKFRWDYDSNAQGEASMFHDAPKEIQNRVIRKRIISCLKNIRLFQYCNKDFIKAIASKAVVRVLPCNSIITAADNRSSWMHVILRGYCEQRSSMAGDKERGEVTVLKAGDAFPVLETLHRVQVLVTVNTITAVETVSLRYSDIVEVLQGYPDVNNVICNKLREHFAKYESILLRRKGRLPDMIPAQKSSGKGDMFTYEIFDDVQEIEENDFKGAFDDLGAWSFLRIFALRKPIDPHGRFFLFWDTFRSVIFVISIFLTILDYNALVRYADSTFIFFRCLNGICVIDFYIRMHCQYYNEHGILVSHPVYTAKHYFSTSFFVDLLGAIPYRWMKLTDIFGSGNRNMVDVIWLNITTSMNLYRFISYLSYLQSDIRFKYSAVLEIIKLIFIICLALGGFAALVSVLVCPPKSDLTDVVCRKDSWIGQSPFKDQVEPYMVYIYCFYLISSSFAASFSGIFSPTTARETKMLMLFFTLFFLMRWTMLSKVTSFQVGVGSKQLAMYREQVKTFLKFMDSQYVDEDIVQATIDHYEHFWKKNHGCNIKKAFSNFHPHLHEDLAFFLYSSTLHAVDLFSGEDGSFFRQFGVYLEEFHYKKDAEIIRCNDVQGLLFFVNKGKVDVQVAMTKVCTLGRGGVFGCFKKHGQTRQTITVKAKVHLNLLVINSNLFHKIIAPHVGVVQKVRQANFLNMEYIQSTKFASVVMDDDVSYSHSKDTSSIQTKKSKILNFYKAITKIINHDSKAYKLWLYIMSVHVASLSSLMLMTMIVMTKSVLNLWWKPFIYILDVIFFTKIYIGLHLSYVDPESGIVIREFALIRRKYLTSITMFWLDLFVCFPFELFVGLATSNEYIISYFFSNRVFRIVYLVQYYNLCQKTLTLKTHLRWAYLLYWMAFIIQIMTCLWWLSACLKEPCKYRQSTDVKQPRTFVEAASLTESIGLAYMYVVNTIVGGGLKDVVPLTLTQISTSTFIMFAFNVCLAVFSCGFANLLAITNYTQSYYEHSIERLKTFLQGQDLSLPILDKLWKYCQQMWNTQGGEWLPALITTAPPYLKQNIMSGLYGHHLDNHVLFANTHIDFLRQLVVHFNRCVYFPGSYLVEKGDIDGSMYFVHSGEVEVYDKQGNNEILRTVLKLGDSFGELQGLGNVPHMSSYKARTVVDVLILKHKDWKYLLQWFPASQEEIFNKAKQKN